MRTSLVSPYIFAALVVIVSANAGFAVVLGAHPFWAIQVAWIGVPLGLILAIAAKHFDIRYIRRVILFGLCLALAYAVATWGKQNFAASIGEDRFAGLMWYLGWIATMCFATATISALFGPTPNLPQSQRSSSH